jgi:nucleotide-binding universal stress UspA family protein
MTQRIVVGVDGSEPSRRALARSAEEAAAHGATLQVIHAWNFLDQPGPGFDPEYGEAAARATVETIVTEVLGASPAVSPEIRMVNDHPGPALIGLAEGAYTLVVGARGLGGFKGLVLGSVSQHLVHHAPCPVLIIR